MVDRTLGAAVVLFLIMFVLRILEKIRIGEPDLPESDNVVYL